MKIEWKKIIKIHDENGLHTGTVDKPYSELTAREHALIQYRCAALTGAVACPDGAFSSASGMVDYCNDLAQAMIHLDDPQT